jgi:hypothetical protein
MKQDYPASSTEPVCSRPVDAMTYDYRAICAELVDAYVRGNNLAESIFRARTLLDQPEQAGEVTKAEIHALADELLDGDRASRVDFARAVLAKWGANAQ